MFNPLTRGIGLVCPSKVWRCSGCEKCNDSVCTVCTSTTQAVRCWLFIGCKATEGTNNGYIYKRGETGFEWRSLLAGSLLRMRRCLFTTATLLPLQKEPRSCNSAIFFNLLFSKASWKCEGKIKLHGNMTNIFAKMFTKTLTLLGFSNFHPKKVLKTIPLRLTWVPTRIFANVLLYHFGNLQSLKYTFLKRWLRGKLFPSKSMSIVKMCLVSLRSNIP